MRFLLFLLLTQPVLAERVIMEGKPSTTTGGVSSIIVSSITASVVFPGTTTVQGNAFSVGGSTLVVSGGHVGIGTTSPAFKLDTNSFSITSTLCNSATSCTNTCAAGLQIITGGCGAGTVSQYITASYPASLTVWNCFSSATTTLTAYTICGSMN